MKRNNYENDIRFIRSQFRSIHWYFSTLRNLNCFAWYSTSCSCILNSIYYIKSVNDLSKYYVFSIKPRRSFECNYKLWWCCKCSTWIVCRQKIRNRMFQFIVFVGKRLSKYWFSTSSSIVLNISSYCHLIS